MSDSSSHQVTGLLRAWCQGNEQALAELVPLVYKELHRAATRHMARENPGHTLQTTALVNEVYLRLVDVRGLQWQDRAHFFAVCATMMRRILTDCARAKQSLKRGGNVPRLHGEALDLLQDSASSRLLAVEEALTALGKFDERKAKIVEMRFFGGLSVEETAEVLKISQKTVQRDWGLAKAWLLRETKTGNSNGS